MARLVVPQPPAEAVARDTADQGDDYLTRVAKYIPSEVIAAYLVILGFLKSADKKQPWVMIVAGIVLLFCLVMTPLYLWRMARPEQPKRLNAILATVAFLVWSYALGGGFFELANLYQPTIGSIVLVAFTLVSGAFTPREGDK